MADKEGWVEHQVREAIRRGDFDNLPGAGKPIPDLGETHDPNWWIKRLVERENITGVLPAALQLRKDDAELDAELDRCTSESEVRELVEDFNARVMHARYTPRDNQPPLVTMPRDLEPTVAAWAQRRAERRAHSLTGTSAATGPKKSPQSDGASDQEPRRTSGRGSRLPTFFHRLFHPHR
ncbi:MAG: DUF1992 domain-containing protein [Nocardioidaceae bacterium]